MQGIGQTIRQTLQIPKGILFDPAFFIFINESQTVSLVGPFVTDIHSDVVIFRDFPTEGIINIRIGYPAFEHGISFSDHQVFLTHFFVGLQFRNGSLVTDGPFVHDIGPVA